MKDLVKRIITEIDNTMFSVDLGLCYEEDSTIKEDTTYQQLALVISGLLVPSKFYREETFSIQDTPARQLAAEIVGSNPLTEDFREEAYFEQEDVLTDAINSWFKRQENIPHLTSLTFVQRIGSIVSEFKSIREQRELRVQDLHNFINNIISSYEKEV